MTKLGSLHHLMTKFGVIHWLFYIKVWSLSALAVTYSPRFTNFGLGPADGFGANLVFGTGQL